MACSIASHAADKAARAASLVLHSVQRDDDGAPLFVYVHCLLCDSTLAVAPEDGHHFQPRKEAA